MPKRLSDIVGSRTLDEVVRGYYPKSGDEQEFVDKHRVHKTQDAAGNGDDVFKASNVKHTRLAKREPNHGYVPPEDQDAHFKPKGLAVKEWVEGK